MTMQLMPLVIFSAIERTKCFIVILPSANTRIPGQVPLQLFLAARSSANLHL